MEHPSVSDYQLTALHALRNDAGRLLHHILDGAPWYQRFGLNHDQQLLDAMLPWYSLSSSICRYVITTVILRNGDRSVSIIPEQIIRGSEKGCMTMCINAPGSISGERIYHLSMAPETGWYIRRGHQSVKENVLMTEDYFFQSVDCLA